MSLTFGYRGPPMMPSKFVDDPLATVASTKIQLCDYEIDSTIQQLGCDPWSRLNPSQQRAVARVILQKRGDPESLKQLDMLSLNNPNYNSYEVVTTQLEDQPSGSLIYHFIM